MRVCSVGKLTRDSSASDSKFFLDVVSDLSVRLVRLARLVALSAATSGNNDSTVSPVPLRSTAM